MSDAPAVVCGDKCGGCSVECAACSAQLCTDCGGCNHAREAALRGRAAAAELTLLQAGACAVDPGEFAMPEDLAEYWLYGEGALEIGWCTDGSFERARNALRDKIPAAQLDGAIANLYRRACGKHPGPHND